MRSHLGCTGSIELVPFGEEAQKRLNRISATWLEYSPESFSLVVRHVQPDDVPPLREVAGELLDYLHAITDAERAQIAGGALYYQDEPTGQYVRLKVWKGGFLTVAWARPDYTRSQWEMFRNQPIALVFEPFQRLNGAVTFEGHPNSADDLRRIIETTSGQYSQGDFGISASVRQIEFTLRDVNADARSLVNALRYMARPQTLNGEIDVSSFRAGDLEDYCRFSFRGGDTWMARPVLWSDTPEATAPSADPVPQAA